RPPNVVSQALRNCHLRISRVEPLRHHPPLETIRGLVAAPCRWAPRPLAAPARRKTQPAPASRFGRLRGGDLACFLPLRRNGQDVTHHPQRAGPHHGIRLAARAAERLRPLRLFPPPGFSPR